MNSVRIMRFLGARSHEIQAWFNSSSVNGGGSRSFRQPDAKRVTAETGLPDIVFNNAGVGKWLCAQETDPADVVSMMASPYFAAFFVTRAFLPDMLKRNSGYIINVTSPASRLVWPGATA